MKLFTRKNISTNDSVFGMTDVGMKREGNEDAFLLLPEKHLYIVSDGMGGHNAGEVASQTAVDSNGFVPCDSWRALEQPH